MMIHKGLLTHDGVAYNATAKVIDLGFNGDFDVKNHAWNMVFVALPAYASQSGAVTLTAKTENIADFAAGTSYTKDTSLVKYKGNLWLYTGTTGAVAAWDDSKFSKLDLAAVQTAFGTSDNIKSIGSVTIPEAVAKKGGVFGMPMPKGLGRYFTLAVSGTTQNLTAGITDQVDTDCNPGVDWTYYKAETKGVCQPGEIENDISKLENAASTASVTSAIATHAALTTGVHGLGE